MKKQIIYVFLFFFSVLSVHSYSQNDETAVHPEKVTKLFRSQKTLPLRFSYSNKDIKKQTNDSTYISSILSYKAEDGTWKDLAVELRVRGNNRLKNCYFPPIKMKLKKKDSKGTLFEGNKKLKLVMPCLLNNDKNDYIVKEHMAYKFYEIISPYHFKTRLVDIYFTENKGGKIKTYDLKGILIEDKKLVAKRHDGKVFERWIHPLAQDPVASVQNSLFQFMIGNTDYSTFVQHNENLIYADKKYVPLPYDFDMSGFVNTSYSVVSVINNESLPISSVRDRLYRGFKRDPKVMQQVRSEFIAKKEDLLAIVNLYEPMFDDPKECAAAKKYISKAIDVMIDNKKFKKEITSKLRTK